MIRRRCARCRSTRYHLRLPEAAEAAARGRAGALWCARCGRHVAPLRLAEVIALRDGVYPEAAVRFERHCGSVIGRAAVWAEAALDRGVRCAPPIESGADLIAALEVACALPGARRRHARFCRRLMYAIGEDRAAAVVWAGMRIAYRIEIWPDDVIAFPELAE